jgi:hypothetical protein
MIPFETFVINTFLFIRCMVYINLLRHEFRLNKTSACFCERLVSTYESTRRHNPEEQHRHFKHSVRAAKETQHVSMTTISWLTLFREIITVYSENHKKHMNTLCVQNAELLKVKTGGTYSYHCTVKGYGGRVYPFACFFSDTCRRISITQTHSVVE